LLIIIFFDLLSVHIHDIRHKRKIHTKIIRLHLHTHTYTHTHILLASQVKSNQSKVKVILLARFNSSACACFVFIQRLEKMPFLSSNKFDSKRSMSPCLLLLCLFWNCLSVWVQTLYFKLSTTTTMNVWVFCCCYQMHYMKVFRTNIYAWLIEMISQIRLFIDQNYQFHFIIMINNIMISF